METYNPDHFPPHVKTYGQIFVTPSGSLYIEITGNVKDVKYLLLNYYKARFVFGKFIVSIKYFPDLLEAEIIDDWI